MASRFTQLRESGLSVEEAWKVLAVETLTEAGLMDPNTLEKASDSSRLEQIQILLAEAKVVTSVRIEPEDDDRINRLLAQTRAETAVSMGDKPSQSSIIRQALRLGMDELERRNSRK